MEMSPGLASDLASLPDGTSVRVFAHFAAGAPAAWLAHLQGFGLETHRIYSQVDAALVSGRVADVKGLLASDVVTYLEQDKQLEYFGSTSSWATRVREAQEGFANRPGLRDRTGLDGSGVGVAIIDSGIDGGHPDFAGRIVKNYKLPCGVHTFGDNATTQASGTAGRCYPTSLVLTTAGRDDLVVDVGPTGGSDTTSGHGLHVAGIAAGDGKASLGTFTGVAPESSLFVYGAGEVTYVSRVLEAYEHLLANHASFTPRVRVVNNSWGDAAGTPYAPNGVIAKVVKKALGLGITPVFAARNDGTDKDDGSGDDMSSYAKDPEPGVISVANYDDGVGVDSATGTGNRDNTLRPSSSRAKRGNAAHYPDIAAPGSFITASCAPRLPLCAAGPELGWQPHYAVMSGTSMASPHVAGIVALLYQANPALAPAAVEDVLQDTAHKFTGGDNAPGPYEPDPQNLDGTIAYDKGAGLIDLVAALDRLDTRVTVDQPTPGASASGSISVAGSLHDATGLPAPLTHVGPPAWAPAPVDVATEDAGDYSGPGAADLVAFRATETVGPSAKGSITNVAGMRYELTVRNIDDRRFVPTSPPPLPSLPSPFIGFRVTQNIGGQRRLTAVNLLMDGSLQDAVAGTSNNARPTTFEVVPGRNTLAMFVPFADGDPVADDTNLGNPAPGSLANNVSASSLLGGVALDVLPGGTGTDALTQPRAGVPYQVQLSRVVPPAERKVELRVDGGAPTLATVSGAYPDLSFVGSVDLSSAAPGQHRIDISYLRAATAGGPAVVAGAATVPVVVPVPAPPAASPPASSSPATNSPATNSPATNPAATENTSSSTSSSSSATSTTVPSDSAERCCVAGGGTSSGSNSTSDPQPTSPPQDSPPAAPDPSGSAQPTGERASVMTRLAGADRIDTAIQVVRASFNDRGAASVVIARSDHFADALAATPLASAAGGPILLTATGSLDPRVEAEIRRVLPAGRTVQAVGGEGALAPAVESRLRELGYQVVRHAGENRFATAVRVADAIGDVGSVFIATGSDFPDALAAGAAAAHVRGAVVLSDGPNLPAATADYLQRRRAAAHFAIGGAAAAAAPLAPAVVGANRFETATRVAERFFQSPTTVGIATGTNFADALAAGGHVARLGGPLLLTRPDVLVMESRSYVSSRSSLARGVVYGGVVAVHNEVFGEIDRLLAR